MTTEQYIAALDKVVQKTSDAFGMAVSTAHATQVERIFEKGQNSSGTAIGSYDPKYKKIREKKNRQTSFVDLKFTNRLQSDFSTTVIKRSPTSYYTGVKNKNNADKIDGLEERYGKIFDLTKTERNEFTDILQKELKNDLNNLRK